MVAVAPALRRNRRPLGYYLSRVVSLWLPLALFLVFTLAPFWYMLVISLKDQQLEVNNPAVFPFWPFHPNFDQYIDLFARTQFPRWALNTTIIASLSTLVSLTFGTLAGYALARLRFRGASLLGIISFVTYLVPQTLLFIPLNIVITRLPVPLFLVTVVFSTVAVGLPLLLLVVPPAIPGILSAFIFAFTLSWNEYIYALVFLTSTGNRTIPVGVVNELIRGDVYFWGTLMAGALLGSIPVAIVYSFFVENYVSGLTAGAVKG